MKKRAREVSEHKSQAICYICHGLRDKRYQNKYLSLGSFRMSCWEIWKQLFAELQ